MIKNFVLLIIFACVFAFGQGIVSMAFVGDLMVHQRQIDHAYAIGSSENRYNFDNCFEPVWQYLRVPDYTVGNLEVTLAGEKAGYGGYPHFNAPDEFGEALKRAGFDLLTTANNHCNDKNEKGLLRTIDMLEYLEIDRIGTYKTQEDRDRIFIKEINGVTFAFLAYTYGTNGIELAKPYQANLLDSALFLSDIRRARALNPDFVVVLPHMGTEYELEPRIADKKIINSMLSAGADIVIVSHPHVLQPMEFAEIIDENGQSRTAFVAYSMGNFVSSQRTVPRDAGFILNMKFKKEEGKKATVERVSYIPTWVKFNNPQGELDIRIVSVYDALKSYEAGNTLYNFRADEVRRLKEVHNEIAKMFQGRHIPLEEIKNEYIFEGGRK